MLLRIIDKLTGVFKRDDFTFDEETEIGLDSAPPSGFIYPKWDFETETWVENGFNPFLTEGN